MTSRNDFDPNEDEDFQQLLVEQLEALQRGDEIDAEQLRRDHPRYAESICAFIENQELMQNAFGGLPEETPVLPGRKTRKGQGAKAEQVTIDSTSVDQQHQGTSWSLARLSEAAYPIEFGEYSLLSEIDRGGMGIVFKAKHQRLNRIVALKVIRAGETSSDEELARFRAEAEASAAIDHPNITPIYEVGEFNGLIYFTMTYVDGHNLSQLIHDQSLAPKEAARIVARVANAVEAAHRCGIIHRDLKPSNILLGRNREPYLIDFGLAKTTHASNALTCTGQILGTPAYMSPEQARGRLLTPACDVYSLGAVLYELVARQPPFSGPTPVDILLQVLNREPTSPSRVNKHLPRALDQIISRAMEKNPADRYPSAESMEADLQRFILDEPIMHPRPTPIERMTTWWRREPELVSHLCGILAALMIVLAALAVRGVQSPHAKWIIVLLSVWAVCSFVLQRISVLERYQDAAHWVWAALDVVIFTLLIYLAAPPRGLLLIGYPMMIAASALIYQTRFVVFVTSMCIIGFLLLWATVDDSMHERAEFCVIYISGLLVLGLCLISMIRRVRGFADYLAGGK